MKIGVIGNGFVGSAIIHGFVLHTDDILVHDKNPDLSTHSVDEICAECPVVFVCVPTPMKASGECDLSIINEVVGNISVATRHSADKPVVVIKSTVVPGTVETLANNFPDLGFVFNPEFLTERRARLDFINTARIVLGGDRAECLDAVATLYRKRFPHTKIISTDFATAQLIKYMANCFFATKVSFMNEMFQICSAIGGDWDASLDGFISDGRIGNSHIDVPGHDGDLGFGGKCFPKDICAMIKAAEAVGVDPKVMKGAWEKNQEVRNMLDWFDIPGAVSEE